MQPLRTHWIAVLTLVALACGDDGTAGDSGSTSSSNSTGNDDASVSISASQSATTPTESTSNDTTASTDPDSSSSAGSSESTSGDSTGASTEPSTESSTSTDSSGAASSSSSESGGEPAGYGDCLNNRRADVCQTDESCNFFGPGAACAQIDCLDPDDCPAAPGGTAEPACFDWGPGPFCGLDCSTGAECPDGMGCFLGMWCDFLIEPPGGGVCPDAVLDGAVPQTFDGDTTALFDDVLTPFAGYFYGTEDQLLEFTAPATQLYGFDISSPDFLPFMLALDGCGGNVFAETTLDQSHMTLSLDAGQTVIIAIEGLDGGVGTYSLQIDEIGPQIGGAECCAYQAGTTGCSVQVIEDCVCADPFCCDTLWDGVCGLRAGECGADCI